MIKEYQKQRCYDWERWSIVGKNEKSDFNSEREIADFGQEVASTMAKLFSKSKRIEATPSISGWCPELSFDCASQKAAAFYREADDCLHFRNYEKEVLTLKKYLLNFEKRKNFYYKTQDHIYYEGHDGTIIQPIHKEEFKECEDWHDKWYHIWCDECDEDWDTFAKKYPDAPEKPFAYWGHGDDANIWVYVPQTKEEWLADSATTLTYRTNREELQRKIEQLARRKEKRLWNKQLYLHEYAHYLTLSHNIRIKLHDSQDVTKNIEPGHGRYFVSVLIWLTAKFGNKDYTKSMVDEKEMAIDDRADLQVKKKSSFKSKEDEQNFLIKHAKVWKLDYAPNVLDILNNKI